jgi:hypothetical protein
MSVHVCARSAPVDSAHNGDPDLINTNTGGHVIGDTRIEWRVRAGESP